MSAACVEINEIYFRTLQVSAYKAALGLRRTRFFADNRKMAAGTTLLTLEEYHAKYAHEAGWEYWFGEAVRKPVPTWYHSVLQWILARFLSDAGFIAGSELDLRIDQNWEPRPDVAGATAITGRYPTKPNEISLVIEILSDDQMSYLLKKCQNYVRIGIEHIYVFDPEGQRIWKWSKEEDDLIRVQGIQFEDGDRSFLPGERIWTEFKRRIQFRKPEGTS